MSSKYFKSIILLLSSSAATDEETCDSGAQWEHDLRKKSWRVNPISFEWVGSAKAALQIKLMCAIMASRSWAWVRKGETKKKGRTAKKGTLCNNTKLCNKENDRNLVCSLALQCQHSYFTFTQQDRQTENRHHAEFIFLVGVKIENLPVYP